MNRTNRLQQRPRVTAFTLIELIVVIAVIGILASLIFPILGALDKKKKVALAQAQLKALEQAIDGYKTKLGFYPPDNTNNLSINQLYFELMGTTNDGVAPKQPNTYGTLDGSAQIKMSDPQNPFTMFSVSGFANSSTHAHSDDSGTAATDFLQGGLTPSQIGAPDTNNPLVKIIVCSVIWPTPNASAPIPNTSLNPWHYVSTHPTNNTSTYDLWADVVVKGKTNRVSNWSAQPIQL